MRVRVKRKNSRVLEGVMRFTHGYRGKLCEFILDMYCLLFDQNIIERIIEYMINYTYLNKF